MRKVLLFLLLLLAPWLLAQSSSSRVYQGFSGGMMLHTGYLFGKDPGAPLLGDGMSCSPQGATFGIGGALRVHLGRYARVGAEGAVSTMSASLSDCRGLLQSGSFVRAGWGGVSADACWRRERVWPYLGGAIGGGSMRALYILEGNESDWLREENAMFHRQGFYYVDPYVGLDWCMTERVHLTFRLDWMVALHHRSLVLPTGPRLYVGFMFCH